MLKRLFFISKKKKDYIILQNTTSVLIHCYNCQFFVMFMKFTINLRVKMIIRQILNVKKNTLNILYYTFVKFTIHF